jgi:hypothetical protein
VIKKFVTIVIALQLALSACGTYPLYEGPERPVEETAVLNIRANDCDERIAAQLIAIDGQLHSTSGKIRGEGGKRVSILPGNHTLRASWYKGSCRSSSSGFQELGLLAIPIILIAIPIGLAARAGRDEPPDYGEGTRDFVATLEAGKEYQLLVRGIDGNKVFLWIAEKEIGAVVGGESPDEKAPAIEDAKSPEPEATVLLTSPALASWDGKWFGKDGAWSLYLEVENGAFTGRALQRGSPFPVTGTISFDYIVAGRVEDERSESTGSLNGMFPHVSVYQSGRVQASFELEKRE